MTKEITLRIILENPVSGVQYGLQKGKGNNYEAVQNQIGNGKDLLFEFPVAVKCLPNEPPVCTGPFAHGIPLDRFVYIDIGTAAGQSGSPWSRRMKIPLTGITESLINSVTPQSALVTKVPGTGKDGCPNCATVKPFNGWKLQS